MLKKPLQILLITITVLFIGIMVGVLIGRRSFGNEIHIFAHPSTDPVHTEPLQPDTTYSGKLNINLATAEELAMLPGLGETYANRIIQYRENNGPFITIEDLMKVKGIGQKRFESISKYITVGG